MVTFVIKIDVDEMSHFKSPTISVSGAYEENKLLNRLFGSYRISFVGGNGCPLDENEGQKLYDQTPDEVPIEENFKPFFIKSSHGPRFAMIHGQTAKSRAFSN